MLDRFIKSKLLGLSLLGVGLFSSLLIAQQTPNQLRVLTDANNSLLVSGTAQVNPISQPTLFSNTRLRTDASGNLVVVLSGGAAPTDATFITQTPNATLTAEQALSGLATGILKNTTTTGVLSIAAASDIPAAGANTQIIFNNAGIYAGDPGLIFNSTTDLVTAAAYGAASTGYFGFASRIALRSPGINTLRVLNSAEDSQVEIRPGAVSVANVGANSCGTTAATIAGNNSTGRVTVGATSGTQCRITFTSAWTIAPSCLVNNETTANLARTTATTTTVDLLGTFGGGDLLTYHCFGY